MCTVHPSGALLLCEVPWVYYLQHCLKLQMSVTQFEAGRSAPLGQACCAGWAKERGRMGVCNHRDRDILGAEGWREVFPVSWLYGPVSNTHTHARTHIHARASQSHIMTTHIHKSFTGLEVDTGKQAEGGKLVYSASHSKSEPWLQPIRYPTAATDTQRGKK